MNINTLLGKRGMRGCCQPRNNNSNRDDYGLSIEIDALLDRAAFPAAQLATGPYRRDFAGILGVSMMRRGFVLPRVGRVCFRLR
jgi:hypothetical protein